MAGGVEGIRVGWGWGVQGWVPGVKARHIQEGTTPRGLRCMLACLFQLSRSRGVSGRGDSYMMVECSLSLGGGGEYGRVCVVCCVTACAPAF